MFYAVVHGRPKFSAPPGAAAGGASGEGLGRGGGAAEAAWILR